MHHHVDKDMLWELTIAFNSIFEFHPKLLFVFVKLNPRRISLAALQANPFISCLLCSISLYISIVWLFLSSLKSTLNKKTHRKPAQRIQRGSVETIEIPTAQELGILPKAGGPCMFGIRKSLVTIFPFCRPPVKLANLQRACGQSVLSTMPQKH